MDEARANLILLNAGLRTRTQVLAEQGIDYEDMLKELKYEKELAEKYGISFQAIPTGNPKMMLDQSGKTKEEI